jgi:hypothetical protein
MKSVEGQLAALIEEILVEKQSDTRKFLAAEAHSASVCRIRQAEAANDGHYSLGLTTSMVTTALLHSLSVFFDNYVKSCAKSAHNVAEFAKKLVIHRRRRAALAACFFGFFCLFPSNSHSANLSTAP